MSTRLVTATVLLATAGLVSACGSSGDNASGSSTTTQPPSPTVTVTVTQTPTSTTIPGPTLTTPGKPNATMSTPPPAKDTLVIPDTAKAYGQAFVTAWVDQDRTRAARLGTASAVNTAFGSKAKAAPAFTTCEGAAGSSYCTWQGDEYTLTVRVLNERASQRQGQAVTEVKFNH